MEADGYSLQTRKGGHRKAFVPRSPTGSCSVSVIATKCLGRNWELGKLLHLLQTQIFWFFFLQNLSKFLWGFPGSSACRASACIAGDPGSISRLGRSTEERIGYPLQYSWFSPVAQLAKNLPAMQETWVLSLGEGNIPLEKGMANHKESDTTGWLLLSLFFFPPNFIENLPKVLAIVILKIINLETACQQIKAIEIYYSKNDHIGNSLVFQ